MIRLQGRLMLMSAAVAGMLLLQGCGQNSGAEGSGESFAAVASETGNSGVLPASEETATPQASADASSPVESPPPAAAATSEAALAKSASPSEEPPAAPDKAEETVAKSTVMSKSSPVPTRKPSASASGTEVKQTPSKKAADSVPSPASPSPIPSTQPAAGQSTATEDAGKDNAVADSAKTKANAKASSAPVTSPPKSEGTETQAVASATGIAAIDWDGFFDGDDQTRPSEHFWDLSGSKVTIKGFMGEVLSFEKNWFLLIPEPGAECPFDNGDETYWNKIMIVFVPEGSKLRYTSGPLEISGRLDVGIKIDESGYKTMFRLYDASFKSI